MKWYSPHTFSLIWIFLIEVAAAAAASYYRYESEVFGEAIPPFMFFQATLVGLIAVVAYMTGWYFGPRGPNFHRGIESTLEDTEATRQFLPIYGLGLLGLSFMAWLYMYATVGGIKSHLANQGQGRGDIIESAGGMVWHIARFGYAASLLVFARFGPLNPISICAVLLMLFFLVFFGSRSFAAILLIAVLIVYFVRFRSSLRMWMIIALFCGLSCFAIGQRLYRMTGGDVQEAIAVGEEQAGALESAVGLVLGDFTFIIQRSEIIDYLQDTSDYQYGRIYLCLLRLIPNKLMPGFDASLPSGNIWYVENLLPRKLYKVSLSSNAFTEFFINLGYPGVILGGFVVGFVIRWLHSRLVEPEFRRYQIIPVIFIGLLAMQLFRFYKSGVVTFLDMFYVFLPLWAVLLVNRMSHRN